MKNSRENIPKKMFFLGTGGESGYGSAIRMFW